VVVSLVALGPAFLVDVKAGEEAIAAAYGGDPLLEAHRLREVADVLLTKFAWIPRPQYFARV
jgi:hypothetical protein